MNRLKKIFGVLILTSAAIFAATAVQGCKSIVEEPTHPVHAMFDVADISLAVGQTVDVAVKNASVVEVISASDIVSVSVSGPVVSVTGLKAGTTELRARADGQVIRCGITVTALPDVPSATDPEPEADRQAALADDGVRAAYGRLELRLSEPGNLFKVSSTGLAVTVASLSSGEHLTLTLPAPLRKLTASSAPLQGVSLTLDDVAVPLREAAVEKVTSSRVWLRCLAASGTVCRFVLPLAPDA